MWSQLAAMISGVLSPVMSATVGVAKKPWGRQSWPAGQ